MSLVILSNNQQEYLTSDSVLGIQNPNSFHNAMSNTITLPPHTEVGVVSAKIHRSPEVVIQDDSVFMIYFGEMLDQSVGQRLRDHSTNVPIPVVMPRGTYTRTQVETVLQTAISDAFKCHPNLAHTGVVVSKPASAGLPSASAGGWSFRITQTSIATPISATDATLVVNDISGNPLTFQHLGDAIQDNVVGLTYTHGTKRITRTLAGSSAAYGWDTKGMAQIKNLPITMTGELVAANGCMSVDFTHGISALGGFEDNEGWEISLTRPQVRDSQAGGGTPSVPEWYNGADNEFADYKVKYIGATGKMELWQSRVRTGGVRQMEMKQVTYYGATITGAPVNYGVTAWAAKVDKTDLIAPYGAALLNRLNWEFKGEQIKVWLSENAFTNPRVLMDTTHDAWAQQGLNRAFKPTGTTTQTLYPLFNLSTQNAYFTLTHYLAPLPWSKRHGETDGYNFPDSVPQGGDYTPSGGSSFWGKAIYDPLYFNQAALERNQVRVRGIAAQTAYVGMDASLLASGALVNNEAIAYGYGFILNNSGTGSGEYTNQGSTENCRAWLGYPETLMPGNVLSYDGLEHTGHLTDANGTQPNVGHCMWLVNSSAGMDFTPKQLFIKCPSLTHQSFNFCKGLTSKILWSLPRFSNSGQTTGPLFFQQSHPIYLSLRNNAPLVINDLQIDFVDKDERIVKDLGGETVVVLHFKTSHHCS